MKKKYLLLVYFIVLHFITSSAQNADRCSDILALGFYGETKTFNSGNEVKDFKSFFEEDKLREYLKNKGSGFNLGVPIKGVTLKLNAESTNAEFQKVKDYINKGNTSNINKAYINFITQQIVDKNVVDAWSKCMGDNSGKIGLQGSYDGDMNDNYFTLIISFASRMGVNSCELSYVDVRGADYDKTFFAKGTGYYLGAYKSTYNQRWKCCDPCNCKFEQWWKLPN